MSDSHPPSTNVQLKLEKYVKNRIFFEMAGRTNLMSQRCWLNLAWLTSVKSSRLIISRCSYCPHLQFDGDMFPERLIFLMFNGYRNYIERNHEIVVIYSWILMSFCSKINWVLWIGGIFNTSATVVNVLNTSTTFDIMLIFTMLPITDDGSDHGDESSCCQRSHRWWLCWQR